MEVENGEFSRMGRMENGEWRRMENETKVVKGEKSQFTVHSSQFTQWTEIGIGVGVWN